MSTTVPVTAGAPVAGTAAHLTTIDARRPAEATTTVDVAPPAA